MPNQSNYVQVIPTNPQAISVSRIAESESDNQIIFGRLPAEFGFDTDDNIEMHFYDVTNTLVGSVVVPVRSGIISAKTILLPNNAREEKIIIDMTRVQKELGLLILPGVYTVTLNYFSDEIGSYVDPKLSIEEVSPSRTELRLGFNTTFTQTESTELFEFVQNSVPRVFAAGLVAGVTGVGTGDIITQAQTEETQAQEFINLILERLEVVDPTLIAELTDLEADGPDRLNSTIEFISAAIYDEFISLLEVTKETKTFDRLQTNELITLIERAVDNALLINNINLYTRNIIEYI